MSLCISVCKYVSVYLYIWGGVGYAYMDQTIGYKGGWETGIWMWPRSWLCLYCLFIEMIDVHEYYLEGKTVQSGKGKFSKFCEVTKHARYQVCKWVCKQWEKITFMTWMAADFFGNICSGKISYQPEPYHHQTHYFHSIISNKEFPLFIRDVVCVLLPIYLTFCVAHQ